MSSKIYARVDAKPAEPLAWPRVEGDVVFEHGTHDPADPQSRLAQLERDLDRRLQEARQAGYQEGAAAAKAAAAAETVRGNLDASVEHQLREIEQGLADRLERAG